MLVRPSPWTGTTFTINTAQKVASSSPTLSSNRTLNSESLFSSQPHLLIMKELPTVPLLVSLKLRTEVSRNTTVSHPPPRLPFHHPLTHHDASCIRLFPRALRPSPGLLELSTAPDTPVGFPKISRTRTLSYPIT